VAFRVRQEKFEGPLETLLDLIEKEKLSISEISLARVADEYLAHVRSLSSPDPEELAEFMVVAAQLMLIKSRSLLPDLELSEEEEVSIDELRQRLIALEKIHQAARELKRLERSGQRLYSREAYLGMKPVFYPPPGLVPGVLAAGFAALVASLPKIEELAEEKLKRVMSLEEKISRIRVILQDAIERGFSEIIKGAQEKIEVILSFLAVLELAKQKFIELKQDAAFGEIKVKRL